MTGDQSQSVPQNLEAEEALLGAMLSHPRGVAAADEVGVRAEDFYRPSHRVLFDTILEVRDGGVEVDELTTINALRASTAKQHDGKDVPALPFVGGAAAVMTLQERCPAVSNAKSYAEVVVEAARKRSVVETGHAMAALGMDATVGAEDAIRQAETQLLELVTAASREHERGDVHDSEPSMTSWLDRYARMMDVEEFEKETLSWGRPELDERLGRMTRGGVYVPAGWTKHGKTWFVLDVAEAVCEQGERVLIASGEMNDVELVDRWVAMAGHDYTAVQEHRIPISTIKPRVEQIRGWQRRTITGKLSIARIRSQVSRAKLEGKPFRLVVLDHLGLLRPDRGAKFQPRREFVEDAVAELKAMAEEYGFTLLLVCQLSRPERTPGNHPRFKRMPIETDLKEASGIEQIATTVVFVYRRMNPETGRFEAQEAVLGMPFHRSRPTPEPLPVEFVLPSRAASSGAYRFVPVSSATTSPTPEAQAVQGKLEETFGPVTVVAPPTYDDVPF